MCGFNPRISAWSIAVPMCPPACTDLRAETPLRTARVDRQSHINVLQLSSRPRASGPTPVCLPRRPACSNCWLSGARLDLSGRQTTPAELSSSSLAHEDGDRTSHYDWQRPPSTKGRAPSLRWSPIPRRNICLPDSARCLVRAPRRTLARSSSTAIPRCGSGRMTQNGSASPPALWNT